MHPNVQNVLWQTGPVTTSGQGRRGEPDTMHRQILAVMV